MIIAPFMELVTQGYLTNTPARILVCGGRDYTDKNKVFAILNELVSMSDRNQLGYHVVIIHGACGVDKHKPNLSKMKGADFLADQWTVCNWKSLEMFPADWTRYGNAAGQVRNRQMLKEGKPTFVVAFPGAGGTAHMVSIAKEADVPVLEVPA